MNRPFIVEYSPQCPCSHLRLVSDSALRHPLSLLIISLRRNIIPYSHSSHHSIVLLPVSSPTHVFLFVAYCLCHLCVLPVAFIKAPSPGCCRTHAGRPRRVYLCRLTGTRCSGDQGCSVKFSVCVSIGTLPPQQD